MFGEVLGLWVIQSWIDIGSPSRFSLAELGPGRGIMMSDMLRTIAQHPDCFKALHTYLIEASAALEAVQGKTLSDAACPVEWINDLSELPEQPTLVIGNEFLDCLPIKQLIQMDTFAGAAGWQERLIGLDEEGRFRFQIEPNKIGPNLTDMLPSGHSEAKKEELLEISPAYAQIIDQLQKLFNAHPGRALFIDYGPELTEFGDTLQALKRHEKIGVFELPGESDLTARVNFAALSELVIKAELDCSPVATQSELLSKLGIEMRAVALTRNNPKAKPKLLRQLHRLMDKQEMGQIFKAITISAIGLPPVLGFPQK